ncbi:MAG: hypothetical protein F4X38_07720, partial [Acidimicrobiaceae bacterium]|nr:hypothetical protein [Acidimicrobiaceae bacterium]
EYVSIRGDRKVTASVLNRSRQFVRFDSIGSEAIPRHSSYSVNPVSELFYEGQAAPFELVRSGPADLIAQELQVRVYSREISGFTGSREIVAVTFPAGETRATGSLSVREDDFPEPPSQHWLLLHFLKPTPSATYYAAPDSFQDWIAVPIRNNPGTVSIAAVDEDATIAEGERADFTLTRRGPTDGVLTVNVSIDDPGHFRRGNHWNSVPDGTAAVTFAAGLSTATLRVPTSDDLRDIPDDTLTVTVLPSQESGRYTVDTQDSSASVTVTDNDTAPQLELRVSAGTVEEGQEAYLEVVRTVDTGNLIDIPVLYGLRGEQEYRIPGLGPGENLIRYRIPNEDDDYDGPDRRVYELTLLPLAGVPAEEQSQYRTISGPSTITITVTDNDLPLVGVEAVKESYTENQVGTFRMVREGQTPGQLDVRARVTETANSYNDRFEQFLGVERTYSLPAYRDSWTWDFNLQGQDGDEADGSLTFQLMPGEGYRIDPARSVATFTVTDTDPTPTLAVTDSTVAEDVGTVEFRVTLSSTVSPPSRRTVTVDYVTEAGTASAGEDYTHVAGTLEIGPGETGGVISVPVLDNGLAELGESFSLVLSNPVNAELQDGAATLTAVGTIEDDEPVVTVEAVATEVEEGSPIRLVFTRSGNDIDVSAPLTVHFLAGFNFDDANPSPADWRQVEIPANAASVTWELATEDDDYDGPDMVYAAVVAPPTWLDLPLTYRVEPGSATVTVRDDDLPVVTIRAERESSFEGFNAEFTLAREGQTGETLTVNVSVEQTNDSETEEADFITGAPPSTVTFAAGSATATLTVPTTNDTEAEPHGTITATITDGEDVAYRVGDPDSASTLIVDTDRTSTTTSLSVSTQSSVVEEGEDAVFVITRTGGTNLNLTARVRVTEIERRSHVNFYTQRTQRFDYTATVREVVFNPGDVSATLTVTTEDESLNDGNSSISARLLLSTQYGIDPFPSIANIWVRDNDIATVSFEQAELGHVETPGQFGQFTLVRTGDTSHALNAWVVSTEVLHISHHFGGDRISQGVRAHPFPINAGNSSHANDTPPEVVGPRGGRAIMVLQPFYCEEVPGDCWYWPQYRVGEISTFTLRVHNSDQAVTVEADRESVNEGQSATFTLTRIGGTPASRQNPLTVRLAATQDGEFIQGEPPTEVTFAGYPSDPEWTKTVTIDTDNDEVYEVDGSITLTILPPAEQALHRYYEVGEGGLFASATVAVVNDDDPAFLVADAEGPEGGGSVTFNVTAPVYDDEMTVDWTTSDGTATAGQDYTADSGTLRFAPGETSKTITVDVLDDDVHEPDETFTVTLSNPTEASIGRATATGTIKDDDPEEPPVVSVWTTME